jgi:hypothetical protein
MHRLGIGIRINRNGSDTHGTRRADDAARNLAPVGDEEGDHQLAFIQHTFDAGCLLSSGTSSGFDAATISIETNSQEVLSSRSKIPR